jgi:hypothetical protein
MDSECEKPMSSTDTLIEAKLSKVSKAFSIENLIAKKVSIDPMENGKGDYLQHQQSKIPPIAFPFYNPWAANYLMSHTNLPQNLLQLNSNSQPLQGDKLSNLALDAQGFVYKDFLLNPLLNIPHEQNATYQLQHHDPTVFAHKLKDTQFLNEFYTNYFMLENNRLLANSTSDKRTKKDFVPSDECNNDSNNSDFDVVNDRDKSETKNGIYYEEDSSYSDLSMTMSPEGAQKDQNKGKIREILN